MPIFDNLEITFQTMRYDTSEAVILIEIAWRDNLGHPNKLLRSNTRAYR